MPVRSIPGELQQKAKLELNEVSDRKEEDLRHIREWLMQQPHLNAKIDDQWLLNFLRGCKFSLQRTKEKLDMFYTVRTVIPEFFSNRDPLDPDIQEILKLGVCLPLLNTADSAAPRVVLIRCVNAEPTKIPIATVIKTCIMITDILLNEDDNFIIAGQQIFLDFRNLTIRHVVQATPALCKKAVVCLQDSYPTRPKGFNFINTPAVVETAFSIVKPMMNEKLKKRFQTYTESNLKDLHKVVPLSVLPKEYGGDGGSLAELIAHWKKKVESYREWFIEDEKFCSDESKRPGKPKTTDILFGVEGSFRKLDLD